MIQYKVQRSVALRVQGLGALSLECERSPQHISKVLRGKCSAGLGLQQILTERTGVRFDESGFVIPAMTPQGGEGADE